MFGFTVTGTNSSCGNWLVCAHKQTLSPTWPLPAQHQPTKLATGAVWHCGSLPGLKIPSTPRMNWVSRLVCDILLIFVKKGYKISHSKNHLICIYIVLYWTGNLHPNPFIFLVTKNRLNCLFVLKSLFCQFWSYISKNNPPCKIAHWLITHDWQVVSQRASNSTVWPQPLCHIHFCCF